MAAHNTHKRSSQGKARTVANRTARAVKHGATRTNHAGRAR